MFWRSIRFLFALSLIILFSPLTAFSEVTAIKLELKQNPDDKYSLHAEFLSDQETKVKFTLITNYQDGKEIPNSNPLETPDDGGYNLHPDETRRIRFDNVIPPNSISEIVKAYIQYNIVGKEKYHDLANGTGEIKGYIDKEGKNIQFDEVPPDSHENIPKNIILKFEKVNGAKIQKGDKVFLDQSQVTDLKLELIVETRDYKEKYTAIFYYIPQDRANKVEIDKDIVTGIMHRVNIKCPYRANEKMVQIAVAPKGSESSTIMKTLHISSKVSIFDRRMLGIPIWIILALLLLIIVIPAVWFIKKRARQSQRPGLKMEGTKDNPNINESHSSDSKAPEKYKEKEDTKNHGFDFRPSISIFHRRKQSKPEDDKGDLDKINETHEFKSDDQIIKIPVPESAKFESIPEWLDMGKENSMSNKYEFRPKRIFPNLVPREPGLSGIARFRDSKKGEIYLIKFIYNVKKIIKVNEEKKTVSEQYKEINKLIADGKEYPEKTDQNDENVSNSNIKPYKLNIDRANIKVILEIPGEQINNWDGKPDWLKMDVKKQKDGIFSFEATSITNKPKVLLWGYKDHKKKHLVAKVLIVPGADDENAPTEKAQPLQENIVDDTHNVFSRDGQKLSLKLGPENSYKEKMEVLCDNEPCILEINSHISGKISRGAEKGKWIIEVSIDNNRNYQNEEVEIEAKYLVRDGKSYVVCTIPEKPPIKTKPIKLTIELDDQELDLSFSKDGKISLAKVGNGQFGYAKTKDPDTIEIQIPIPPTPATPTPEDLEKRNEVTLDRALAVLVLHSFRIFANLDADGEAIRKKRELLAEWAENPDNADLPKRLFGLDIKEDGFEIREESPKDKKTDDKTDDKVDENEGEQEVQSVPKGSKLGEISLELLDEIKGSPYYEEKEDDIAYINRIIGTITDNNFSLDDPAFRSLINWSLIFFKRVSKSPNIWDVFVDKMKELGVYVIYKEGIQYNELDYKPDEGPTRDAIVDKVIQPGFKTIATGNAREGSRILEQAIVITKSI